MYIFYNIFNGVVYFFNGLIVWEDDYLVLLDFVWGVEVIEVLLVWIDKEIGLLVDWVLFMYFYSDCIGGVVVLVVVGILVWLYLMMQCLSVEVGNLVLVNVLIGLDIVGNIIVFGFVEVFYFGGGYVCDNIMVWLFEWKMFYGGCVVCEWVIDNLGNIVDVDLVYWL